MRAGQLNQRVTIERKAAGQDSVGQPAQTWQTVATVWADLRHPGGLEAIRAGADTSLVRASVRIRFRDDIDAGMRVAHGAVYYDIKAVLPDAGRREYLDLLCERVQ